MAKLPAKTKTTAIVSKIAATVPTADAFNAGLASYYASQLDGIDKKLRLRAGAEITPDPISTGLLCADWVLSGGARTVFNQVAGFEQAGKCVHGDTLVNTSEGFVHMDEFISSEGTKQCSLQITTEHGTQSVSHTYSERSCSTIRVTTHSGLWAHGTLIHPMLVVTSNLELEWRKLSDVQVGDWIVAQPRTITPLFGCDRRVNLELATIMGMLTANGVGSRFYSKDEQAVEIFCQAARRVTGHFPTKIEDSVPSYRVSSRNRKSFYDDVLVPLGYCGSVASDKQIPQSVRRSPQPILHEYLESYFQCDCGVNGHDIELISASQTLIEQLQVILLQAYNVYTNYDSYKSSAKNSQHAVERIYYRLKINSDDAIVFLRSFKRAKAQRYADRFLRGKKHAGGTTNKVVPYVRKLTRNAYMAAAISTKRGDTRVKTITGETVSNFWKPSYINASLSGVKDQPHASRLLFDRTDWNTFIPHLARIDPNLAGKIQTIVDLDARFERVVRVESGGKHQVYDVTVPTTASFLANGLVSHNTTLTVGIFGGAVKMNVPIIEYIDAEGSLTPDYADAVLNSFGLSEIFDQRLRRYYSLNVLEDATNQIARLVRRMPDKLWFEELGCWAYVIPKGLPKWTGCLEALKAGGLKPDKAATTEQVWVYPTEYSGPEAALFLDSWPALNPEAIDDIIESEKDSGAGLAILARTLANELPKFAGRLKRKGVMLWSVNQLREAPMSIPPIKEPGGNALRNFTMVRNQMAVRAVPDGWDKDPQASNLCIEESAWGNGYDRYAFKEFKNTKNKMGRPFLKTMVRVWTSDETGYAQGYDPVFDVWNYLKITEQVSGGRKQGFTIRLKDTVKGAATQLNGLTMKWWHLKAIVLAEHFKDKELLKPVAEELGFTKAPNLRATLFKQVREDQTLWGEQFASDDGEDEEGEE